MLWTRVISAAVGAPVLIACAWVGGVPLLLVTVTLALLGWREFSSLLARKGIRPSVLLGYGGNALILAAMYGGGIRAGAVALTVIVVGAVALQALAGPGRCHVVDAAATVFGCLYTSWLFGYFLLLRAMPAGHTALLLLFALVWVFDTAGYFVGRRFGRKRLSAAISPGKTVEGLVGGLLAAAAAGAVAARLAGLPSWHGPLLGAGLGLAGQLGDLGESAMKRYAEVKDAGTLIPGHGGVLDRFDSLLLSAPVLYYYLRLLAAG